MKVTIMVCYFCQLCLACPSYAEIISRVSINPSRLCAESLHLSTITGKNLYPLIGTPVQNISLYRYKDTQFMQVIFQMDEKNAQGRYIIDNQPSSKNFDMGDELVFKSQDMGEKLPPSSEFIQLYELVEIEIRQNSTEKSAWLYARIAQQAKPGPTQTFIQYEKARDAVITDDFKIGFSSATPFLVDSFQWKNEKDNSWSLDVTDTMKIRHTGKFLGYLDFARNQEDYRSTLTAVKPGPLRIIRRTENKIRVLWKLSTPSLYIDYILSPDGFVMDTIIDIPINVGVFFNDLETLTTMDWNNDQTLPPLVIKTPGSLYELPVKGVMSTEKEAVNFSMENTFSVHSAYGDFLVQLDVAEDFPIQYGLYLQDDINQPDEPENHLGQFGNVGFRTTQWEKIDTEIHHLKFKVCILPAQE